MSGRGRGVGDVPGCRALGEARTESLPGDPSSLGTRDGSHDWDRAFGYENRREGRDISVCLTPSAVMCSLGGMLI